MPFSLSEFKFLIDTLYALKAKECIHSRTYQGNIWQEGQSGLTHTYYFQVLQKKLLKSTWNNVHSPFSYHNETTTHKRRECWRGDFINRTMKNGHFIPEWSQVAEGEGLNDKPKRTVRGGASLFWWKITFIKK